MKKESNNETEYLRTHCICEGCDDITPIPKTVLRKHKGKEYDFCFRCDLSNWLFDKYISWEVNDIDVEKDGKEDYLKLKSITRKEFNKIFSGMDMMKIGFGFCEMLGVKKSFFLAKLNREQKKIMKDYIFEFNKLHKTKFVLEGFQFHFDFMKTGKMTKSMSGLGVKDD